LKVPKAAKTGRGPIFQVAFEQLVEKKQRIVQDPVAYRLLPTFLRSFVVLCRISPLRMAFLNLVDRKVPGVHGGILCRKRYIEDKLLAALKDGLRTVVILGAGFDTLAYRRPELASAQVFELDFPGIIQAKQMELQRTFDRIPPQVSLIAVDFNTQDLRTVLQQTGCPLEAASFFIWEGVTQYIPETAVRRVFEFLQKAPTGSQLVFTYVRKDFIEGKNKYGLEVMYQRAVARQNLWQFGLDPQEIAPFLASYSWEEVEQAGAEEYQARYLGPLNRQLKVMEIERVVHAQK
jgi:methyltransferase (TIGR00027 family)